MLEQSINKYNVIAILDFSENNIVNGKTFHSFVHEK